MDYSSMSLLWMAKRDRSAFIAFLEAASLVGKILVHLDLRDTGNHDPPPENDSHTPELAIESSESQIPSYDSWD